MKITLIHNPKAGYEQPPKEQLLEALNGSGTEITYLSSKDDTFNEFFLSHPKDVAVVVGGDGTIRKVAYLLLMQGKRVPIAVIPAGTANNISKMLDESIEIVSSNDVWLNLETRDFDAGSVTIAGEKEYFFESAGFGIIPEMMHRFNEFKKQEQPEYESPDEEIKHGQSFLQNMLREFPASHYDITIDGENYAGRYLLVEIMNIQSVGSQLSLAPDADAGDGLLDIVLIRENEREALLNYIDALLKNEAVTVDFTRKRGKSVAVSRSSGRFHIDDEVLPDGSRFGSDHTIKLEIEVHPQSLSFFTNTFKL